MDIPLAFEPLTSSHTDLAAALWSDPVVIRYTAVASPLSRKESEDRMAALLDMQRKLSFPTIFAVMYKGEHCGIIGCLPVDHEKGVYSLFYQFRSQAWGKGIGGSSARWLLAYMRQRMNRLVLIADAAAVNTASIKILESLEFQKEGEGEKGVLHYILTLNRK